MSHSMVPTILVLCGAVGCAQSEARDQSGPVTREEAETRIDWAPVDAAMGRKGALQEGNVYRFGMPRSDLSVISKGVEIRPSFALGSWLAMLPAGGGEVVAMGDLVLTESELEKVLPKLQESGIGQTALHKHLPEHTPDLWWAHIHARGNPVEIATAVRGAVELTGTPASAAGSDSSPLALDTVAIREALGHSGRVNSGVYSVTVPRAEQITSMGVELPPSMGISTAINFQPTGSGLAAVNGDFVMVADEIDGVIASLLEHGIEVVSVHNHLSDEEPRLFFLHFWATGDPLQLAEGLRAALDRTSTRDPERVWNFDDQSEGEAPSGWALEQTNPQGEGAVWQVEAAESPSGSNILALVDTRGARGNTFNIAWTDEAHFEDGRIEVKVLAREGEEDRGGGPIWRVQDANNYYIARWNPLEDNLRVYVVVDGSRRQLESADVDASGSEWHTIAIEHIGDRISGTFDGRPVLEVTDGTFAGPGGIGVWTKADAASGFDDLRVSGGEAAR